MNQPIDTAFGAGDGTADGKITVDLAGMGDGANAVALDADGRIVAAGGAYVPGRSTDFALVRLEGSGATGPEAIGLSMGSSTWTTPFRTAVAGAGYGDGQGLLVQRGQFGWSHLGWVNVDEITVRFRGPAEGIVRESLRVRGTNVAEYPIAGLNYDPATRTATWRLAQPGVNNDRIVVELNTDADPAFEYQWRPTVLGGDATGDGLVNATDLSELRRKMEDLIPEFTPTASETEVSLAPSDRPSSAELPREAPQATPTRAADIAAFAPMSLSR